MQRVRVLRHDRVDGAGCLFNLLWRSPFALLRRLSYRSLKDVSSSLLEMLQRLILRPELYAVEVHLRSVFCAPMVENCTCMRKTHGAYPNLPNSVAIRLIYTCTGPEYDTQIQSPPLSAPDTKKPAHRHEYARIFLLPLQTPQTLRLDEKLFITFPTSQSDPHPPQTHFPSQLPPLPYPQTPHHHQHNKTTLYSQSS